MIAKKARPSKSMSTLASASENSAVQTPTRATRRRLWVYRLIAVLLGLSPLVALEGVCLLFDWGRPSLHDDPFVGFRSTRPLFVLNQQRTEYSIPKARQNYFPAQSFPAAKEPNEFRIFCLGGSTVEGEPYGAPTSFTTWLEISLQSADPSRPWRVINCGGVSYATYRLVPVLEEVLHYQPDLIIFYEGHNEFLENRAYDHLEHRGPLVNAALDTASRLRSFTLLREGYLRLRGASSDTGPEGRPVLPTEVEALLDYRGGLAEYHHDDAWRRDVINHFQYSLARIVRLTREAGVNLLLVNPVSNLADSPPFKCEHGPDLSPAQIDAWDELCEAARGHLRGEQRDLPQAIRLFRQACQLDPRHAGAFYNLAKCYETAGDFAQARTAYLQAKELDVCPLRILQPMNEAILAIAEQSNTPLFDANELFQQRSRHQIVDGQWLIDHVHPKIEGHQLLADALTEKLIQLGQVHPVDGWEPIKQRRYREHFDALGNAYLTRGMARLQRLQGWAHGRVKRLHPGLSDADPSPKDPVEKP